MDYYIHHIKGRIRLKTPVLKNNSNHNSGFVVQPKDLSLLFNFITTII